MNFISKKTSTKLCEQPLVERVLRTSAVMQKCQVAMESELLRADSHEVINLTIYYRFYFSDTQGDEFVLSTIRQGLCEHRWDE